MFELILLAILVVAGVVGAASLMFVLSVLLSAINFATWLVLVAIRTAVLLALAPFRLIGSVIFSDAKVRKARGS